jgi:hypothetical protein
VIINAAGIALIVSFLVEIAGPQPGLPLAANVNVTLPAAISAALGLYVAVVKEFALVNVPVPLEVHDTLL